MNWTKKDDYHLESSTGYRVSKSITNGLVVYVSWGRGIDWNTVKARSKPHYGLNEYVPMQRSLIGIYETAQDAQDACEQDSRNG